MTQNAVTQIPAKKAWQVGMWKKHDATMFGDKDNYSELVCLCETSAEAVRMALDYAGTEKPIGQFSVRELGDCIVRPSGLP